jgi:two-component system, chemotaxis family, protein-glutamate methylesterase/glutaminase
MLRRDIIVIGGSAGALEAIPQLVRGLPEDLAAAVFVVIHTTPRADSRLASILTKAGSLPAVVAEDEEPIQNGRIYVARPDCHMVLQEGRVRLLRSTRENGSRPAIDPLFRSAARAYGPRVVGVLVSGVLSDGTAGLMAIKLRNGVAIVQDPEEALYPGMPAKARESVELDAVLPVADIAATLVRLNRAPVQEREPTMDLTSEERVLETIQSDFAEQEHDQRDASPSLVSCPECGGTLWEFHQGKLLQFQCHVGHRYMPDALLLEQTETLERALWASVRMLQEKATVSRQLAHRHRQAGQTQAAARFEESAHTDEESMRVLRQLIATAAVSNAANVAESQESPSRAAALGQAGYEDAGPARAMKQAGVTLIEEDTS